MVFFRELFTIMGKPISGFRMNNISYNDTRGINAHIDYPTHERVVRIINSFSECRVISIQFIAKQKRRANSPGRRKSHLIRIELKDAHGNTSNLKFQVKYKPKWEKKILNIGKIFYPGMVDGFEAQMQPFIWEKNVCMIPYI